MYNIIYLHYLFWVSRNKKASTIIQEAKEEKYGWAKKSLLNYQASIIAKERKDEDRKQKWFVRAAEDSWKKVSHRNKFSKTKASNLPVYFIIEKQRES